MSRIFEKNVTHVCDYGNEILFVDHVINRRTGKTCHKGARSGGGGTGASREAT